MRNHSLASRRHASGSALLIAVVLLLLAGVMTVLAMNVGIFEQRSTANDVRARAVHEVAEAGLAQGAEFLFRQNPAIVGTARLLDFPSDTATWTPCAANDDTFPCGSVGTDPVSVNGLPGGATVPRRATMYRLTNSGAAIAPLDAALVSRMLPMTGTIPTVGTGFPVAYGVAPVMCFVARRVAGEANDAPIRCAVSADQASSRRIATLVSVASIVGENARTTLTQTMGRYPLINDPIGKPPFIASGTVDLTGTLQIVTNPNGGGTGVPVSIWSRRDVDKTGTPNTCYADEFFRFGARNNQPPTFAPTNNKVILCDTCQCVGNESLSLSASGAQLDEGIDVLDVEGTSQERGSGINHNVRSDSLSFPVCEFPPDMFAHVLGVRAWEDADEDCFAEQKIMRTFVNPNTGIEMLIGADEAFLYQNAKHIINATPAGAPLRSPEQQYTGAYPSAALSGLIWCQSSCNIGSNTQLGTPDKPVVLVIDGSARIQGRVFGLVFLRSTADGATLTPPAGYRMSDTTITAGGNAVLDMNAGAAVYGAVVVQGSVGKANGSAAIIYDAAVLEAIDQANDNFRFGTLPGAWNDRSTY